MSVDTTIPSSSNNVGDDLSAIRENFELLASAQVVDEGSTSDGDYIRYENGWQICRYRDNDTEPKASGRIGDDWDYPQSFISEPSVSAIITNLRVSPSRAELGLTEISSISATSCDYDTHRVEGKTNFSGGDLADFILIAIGRWK